MPGLKNANSILENDPNSIYRASKYVQNAALSGLNGKTFNPESEAKAVVKSNDLDENVNILILNLDSIETDFNLLISVLEEEPNDEGFKYKKPFVENPDDPVPPEKLDVIPMERLIAAGRYTERFEGRPEKFSIAINARGARDAEKEGLMLHIPRFKNKTYSVSDEFVPKIGGAGGVKIKHKRVISKGSDSDEYESESDSDKSSGDGEGSSSDSEGSSSDEEPEPDAETDSDEGHVIGPWGLTILNLLSKISKQITATEILFKSKIFKKFNTLDSLDVSDIKESFQDVLDVWVRIQVDENGNFLTNLLDIEGAKSLLIVIQKKMKSFEGIVKSAIDNYSPARKTGGARNTFFSRPGFSEKMTNISTKYAL